MDDTSLHFIYLFYTFQQQSWLNLYYEVNFYEVRSTSVPNKVMNIFFRLCFLLFVSFERCLCCCPTKVQSLVWRQTVITSVVPPLFQHATTINGNAYNVSCLGIHSNWQENLIQNMIFVVSYDISSVICLIFLSLWFSLPHFVQLMTTYMKLLTCRNMILLYVRFFLTRLLLILVRF